MATNFVLAILLFTVTATAITTITNVSSPEKENNPFIYEHETVLYNQDYVFIYDYPNDKALIILVLDGSVDLRTNNSSIENNSYFSGTGSYRKILVFFQVLWVPWFFLVDDVDDDDDEDDDFDDDDDDDFDDGDDENDGDDSKEEEAGDDDGYDSYEEEKRRWEEEERQYEEKERRWKEDMKKRDEELEDFERMMELADMYDKQLDEEYYELLKWEYDDEYYYDDENDDENDMINYIQEL